MPAREMWKPIDRFQGKYQASNLGRIRNAKTKQPLIARPTPPGYYFVRVFWQGRQLSVAVAPLIAQAWKRNRPPGYQVDHHNQIKADNRAVNLKLTTQSKNIKRSYMMTNRIRRTGNRLSQQARDLIMKYWNTGMYSQVQIGKKLGVSNSTVQKLVSGQLRGACGTRDLVILDVDVTNRTGVQKMVTIGGVSRPLQDWLREYGLSQYGYSKRKKLGLSDVEAITMPKKSGSSILARRKSA